MRRGFMYAAVCALCLGARALTGSAVSAVGVLDTVAPSVTGISVTGSSAIEVTFDEAMLSGGALTTTNYTLSGPGAGTLAVHPDSVTGSGPYTLTWSSGEMLGGAALSITASGVQDAAGNAIGASNVGNGTGVGIAPGFTGISAAPATAAVGEVVEISFTASETLDGDPEVTVNGNAAALTTAGPGLAYTFSYTVLAGDALGAATIGIAGLDLAGNAGVANDSAALTIVAAPVQVPVGAWPLLLLLPAAGVCALRRRTAAARVAAIALLGAGFAWAAAPVVSNVSFSQRADGGGTVVDIYFDLAIDGPACDISVALSKDGGTDGYAYAATSISGDVVGVTSGTGHHIVWDIATDYPGENITQARVRVTANDGAIAPVLNTFSIDNGAATSYNRALTLNNTISNGPVQYMASLASDFGGASWAAYDSAPSFEPGAVSGTITVYFKVRNSAGESGVLSDTISYFPFDAPEMLPVTGDTFSQGDVFGGGDSDETPVHDVTLSDFEIGKYEITNGQFADVLNWANAQGYLTTASATSVTAYGQTILFINDSACQISFASGRFSADTRDGFPMDEHPVLDLPWYGAAAFCNWASQMAGLTPCFNTSTWVCDFAQNGYKLPTEAQWEFAASYDAVTPGPASDRWYYGFSSAAVDSTRANYANLNPLGLTDHPYTTPVGYYDGVNSGTALSVSPVGAFDMSGNVLEWCYDRYGSYSSSAETDPTGAASGTNRAVKGGAYIHFSASALRTSDRVAYTVGGGDFFLGFRVAR